MRVVFDWTLPLLGTALYEPKGLIGNHTEYVFGVILFVWVYQQECLDKIFLGYIWSGISEI
jgi:hypothetical protein